MTLAYTKNGKKVNLTYTSQGILIEPYKQKKNSIAPICILSNSEFKKLLDTGELMDKVIYRRIKQK